MVQGYGKSNRQHTQLQPLISVDTLRKSYLFGVADDISDPNGNFLSDEILQNFIDVAVSYLETDLDLAITPRSEEEQKDFYGNDYFAWSYFQLNRYPVITIDQVFVSYLRLEDGSFDPKNIIQFPTSWWRLKPETGILRMIPNNKFPASLQIDQTGNFFPELFRREGQVPNLFVIQYTWGLKEGQIPPILNHAIGILAAIFALSPLGNLILGPGIAGSSLGLDGISQSISTTMGSGEGGAFAGQVADYKNQLFGKYPNDPASVVQILRNYFKGAGINMI